MPHVRIWLHLVWSTKCRQPLLQSNIKEVLIDHMLLNARKKNIYVNCMDGYLDHLHALILLNSDMTTAKLMQLLKGESSHWLNEQHLIPGRFEWQEEYYGVSVSEADVEAVRRYIEGQEEHHRKKSFIEECEEFTKTYVSAQKG